VLAFRLDGTINAPDVFITRVLLHVFIAEIAMAKLASMSVDALLKMRDEIGEILSRRADDLKRQLSALTGSGSERQTRGPGRRGRKRKSLKGRKVPAQFRSKKNPRVTWSGRGATPRWMKAEMKGTKLTKESFRIK
jgi:DNA-binding protein H-NS